MMMSSSRYLSCALLTLSISLVTSSTSRLLEDNGNVDLSGYTMREGVCFRSKIQDDGDDDGNSYFYNGSFRAQYERYSSFFMCQNGNCDFDQRYVADMTDYLQAMTNYVENMCDACSNNCRRFLEEGGEEEDMAEEWAVNCKTCSSDCQLVWSNNNGNVDETDYLECQYSLEDNGIAYYSAPACQDGSIVIGHFYDEDCSVKAALEFNQELSYSYFRTIEQIQVDCSSGLCDEIYNDAIDCNNDAADDQDNAKLCKAANEASKVRTYYKKPWFKKVPLKAGFFLTILLLGTFTTLSYVYFVRHRRAQVPLANLDGTPTASDYGQMA